MTSSSRLAAALAIGATAAATCLLAAGSAEAASCRVVTVQNAVPVGIALSPQRSAVPYGGCVQFSDNAFGPPVTITVAGGYTTTLNYGESTSGKTNYAARSPGVHAVTASNGPATAHGRITVGPAPTRSPQPSRSPSPSKSPAPQPAPSSSSPTTGPQVAHSPRAGGRPPGLPSAHPPPVAPGVSATPGAVPSVAGSPPGPLQSTTPAPAIVAGPLEPPTGRSLGLPAALAALVLIGVGTAVVRVVMAEPVVDDRRSVGGTA